MAVQGNSAYTSAMIREQIQEKVWEALSALHLPHQGVVVEYIEEVAHGDITTNAAMVVAKVAGKSPRELAESLIVILGEIDGVEKIEIAGPGFINFTLKADVFAGVVSTISNEWGKNHLFKDKKIMVEYTDPNPFKEFHIGHLMSNAVGESIARLMEYTEATTKRANYQGDVGPHIAQAIWAIQKFGIDPTDAAALGTAYAKGATAAKEDPIAKEEIDVINKKVYDRSDPVVNDLYDRGRATSLAHFEELYAILGTHFDHYFFESQSAPIGIELVRSHPEIFEESEGAIVYKGEQDGLHTRVFITSQGTPTYDAKDLGLIRLKDNTYPVDISITVTASEQLEYFKVMIAAARRFMPELADKVRHITHGMMRLPSGKMSSRTGDVITGESLLLKLIEAAHERAKESKAEDKDALAEEIAVAAIKFQILKQGIGKDIVFDEARALSLEGDSGPYIQYAYARTRSIITAAEEVGIIASVEAPQTEDERSVARLLMQFPDVVRRAQEEYEPHHVATYAASLASLYNSWYAHERVIGDDAAPRRLALTMVVATTLHNALWLLGIPAPERM